MNLVLCQTRVAVMLYNRRALILDFEKLYNYKNTRDFIFISDVDVALPANLYQLYFKHVRTKRAWYPICQMLGEDEKETRSYPEGVGLVGFKQSGNFSLNDEIKTWGNEDWEFLFQLYHAGIYPIRNQNGNFLHYYHPPVAKNNYKKIW